MPAIQRPAWPTAHSVAPNYVIPVRACTRYGDCAEAAIPVPVAAAFAVGLGVGILAVVLAK